MLIAQCKLPRIDKSLFPPRLTDVETGEKCPDLAIRRITPYFIGCYSAWPHDDGHVGGYFVIMTIQSNEHYLSDSKYHDFEPAGIRLIPGALTIINANTLHWLYQDVGDGAKLFRRSFWVGLSWGATRRQLKPLVRSIVSQHEGKWTPKSSDKRYSFLFPNEALSAH